MIPSIKIRAECASHIAVIPFGDLVVWLVLAMNESLHGVAIVVENKAVEYNVLAHDSHILRNQWTSLT